MTRNWGEFIADIEPVRDDPLCAPPAVELGLLVLGLPVLGLLVLGLLVALPPVVDPIEDAPSRFWIVPFTSTRFPTRLEKLDALPDSRYVEPLVELVDPVVAVPVGLAVELPVVDPAVPVDALPEPLDSIASVRM